MPDSLRLLHARSQHGYTDNPSRAMFGEPEAVSADVQRELTADSLAREHEAQVAQWRTRRAAIARELDWLRSQRFQRDVRSAVRALDRQLANLDRRIAG